MYFPMLRLFEPIWDTFLLLPLVKVLLYVHDIHIRLYSASSVHGNVQVKMNADFTKRILYSHSPVALG